MGMYDNLVCECDLPDWPKGHDRDKTVWFQTKSFECLLDLYRISEDGTLFRQRELDRVDFDQDLGPEEPFNFTGSVNFYTDIEPVDGRYDPAEDWVEYDALFNSGQLVAIQRNASFNEQMQKLKEKT